MENERLDYENLTEDEKELLYYFFRMDKLNQMRFLGKVEQAAEMCAKFAKALGLEVNT